MLVLSASAIGSSHVGREIGRAASKHEQIIALKMDKTPLTPALFAAGRKGESDVQLTTAIHRYGESWASDIARVYAFRDQADGNVLDIAEVYAFRNQLHAAMHWLDRAYAQKDGGLYSIKRDSLLKGLEGDPRYKAFLKKMNLPQ